MSDNASTSLRDGFLRSGGNAAERFMANGLNINSLRTNDVLETREWLQYDTAVVQASVMRLNGIADLIAMGLTMPLPNALGTTVVQWDDENKMQPAEQSMDGISSERYDRTLFSPSSVPVYISHKDFRVSLRTLEASRRYGTPLDVSQASNASRRVSEILEKALFQGSGVTLNASTGSATSYGYTNAPQRHTVSKQADWATATGAQIMTDVLAAIAACQASFYFGPYMLYVSTAWWVPLMNDFKTYSTTSILERLRELAGIIDIKPADQLPANSAVVVQMTSDVVDLVDGYAPTTVMWDTEGGFLINFKVLAIQIPRIKSHQDGNSGIAHIS